MIFSKEKWEDEREGLDYVKVSNALSWETIQSPLRNAYDLFIIPLIGETMSENLIEIYAKSNRNESENKLIHSAKRANILLALWYDYAELNVLMGDTGFKRQESDNTKTPYKYQEKQLRDGWKTKGFNALDDLLAYLETNIADYAAYKESENYTESRKAIIQNAGQVNDIYFINHSRLTYLRLKSHFKIVEETIIAPRMGVLFSTFKAELEKETVPESYVSLKEKLQPVVVYYAVSQLLLETGDLSDKGLFFASLSGDDGESNYRTVADDRIVHQAQRAEMDGNSYWKLAQSYILKHFGIDTSDGGFPRRNNTNKKAFWA
jgi:hypothetical protein